MFVSCSLITEINLPELTSFCANTYLFSGYSSYYNLSNINIPKASLAWTTQIPMSLCPNLQTITLGISYMSYTFGNGYNYSSINHVHTLNLPYLNTPLCSLSYWVNLKTISAPLCPVIS